jgi:hypothetical protein
VRRNPPQRRTAIVPVFMRNAKFATIHAIFTNITGEAYHYVGGFGELLTG